MHTHPPLESAGSDVTEQGHNPGTSRYPFFSDVDVRSLLSTGAALSGLVTDRLWLLFRTSETPVSYARDESTLLTQEYLMEALKMKIYTASFGKSAISVHSDNTGKNDS